MIHALPEVFTQKTALYNYYPTLSTIISSQNMAQSHTPRKERYPWWGLDSPNAFPRKIPASPSQHTITTLHLKALQW
jgi:hypothetical protein